MTGPRRTPRRALAAAAGAALVAAACRTGAPAGSRAVEPAAEEEITRVSLAPPPPTPAYQDPDRPVDERVADLLARLTLEEKVAQMMDQAPAIDRLGVPAYGWWNEALHGVARAGVATVFPQAIALAATFDVELMGRVATAISDEARAKHHEALRHDEHGRYQGLTFFSPNINIFRDPRWGRGHETYGEDPFLAARLAVAFIRGLQGDDPTYLKTAATAKHYAVHSGPEALRHRFDARVSERDLFDTYLPQFEAAVREGGVASVMSAYNAVGGEPASSHPRLLREILRGAWEFSGYVVTDCGAVRNIWRDHKVVATQAEAAARAVKAGVDLECGGDFKALPEAVRRGLVAPADIDRAVSRLFAVRMRLGMFDPPARVRWAQIPFPVNDSPAHRRLAREAAQKAVVLLENRGRALPLALPPGRTLAVIGPTADSQDVLLGNYNGTPSAWTTILAGVRAAAAARGLKVAAAAGAALTGDPAASRAAIRAAVALVRRADATILVLGLSPRLEGEEGEWKENPSGDRVDIGLPAPQQALLDAVIAARRPTVLVLTGGSALAIETARAKLPAILMAWYPGAEGGAAVADVLFGDANPAGRLPVTFYRRTADLPPFPDYAMAGRTYRYFRGAPAWPFGYGLSYTTFSYTNLRVDPPRAAPGDPVRVSVDVTNTGARAGDEVVQLYLAPPPVPFPAPRHALAGVARVHLAPGTTRTVAFALGPRELSVVDEQGRRVAAAGEWHVAVGGGQPGDHHAYPAPSAGVSGTLDVRAAAPAPPPARPRPPDRRRRSPLSG